MPSDRNAIFLPSGDQAGAKSIRVEHADHVDAGNETRLAMGHTSNLNPVPNWDFTSLAGAGALRSTANDMLRFLAAYLGYEKTPLADAMSMQLSIRRPTTIPNAEIAYGWHVYNKDGNSIIAHNGGTGGYRTCMGYDPKSRRGCRVVEHSDVWRNRRY